MDFDFHVEVTQKHKAGQLKLQYSVHLHRYASCMNYGYFYSWRVYYAWQMQDIHIRF